MAEFEEKLNAILSDPKAMGQIMSIAKALGSEESGDGQAAAGESGTASPSSASASEPDLGNLFSSLDPKMIQAALRLFSEYNSGDDRRTALLAALLPFLKEERHAKVDKAVQITKLSRMARVAFRLLKGEGADV